MIQRTLETHSASVEKLETKQGKLNVIDIYSQETGYTVRINNKTGKFVSLKDEATPAIKRTIESAKND